MWLLYSLPICHKRKPSAIKTYNWDLSQTFQLRDKSVVYFTECKQITEKMATHEFTLGKSKKNKKKTIIHQYLGYIRIKVLRSKC